jgi:putative transposase
MGSVLSTILVGKREKQMYGTIQVNLNVLDSVRQFFLHQCEESNSFINCAVYQIRQDHFDSCDRVEFFDSSDLYRQGFKTKKVHCSYAELCKVMADNIHYKVLGGQCAQQTLKGVVESFRSFNGLLTRFWKGEGDKPKMPGYRTKGGLAAITYPAQAIRFDRDTGECIIPISREIGTDILTLGVKEIRINGCTGIKVEQICELRIVPRNGELYAEYVYEFGNAGATCNLNLDHTQALGLDPGVDNWLTGVTTQGKSFILDGRQIKSINQNYNKQVAKIKTGKPDKYWDAELSALSEKRNRQMRDAINKSARFVVNYCLEHNLGVIVFGWGQGVKNGVNLGKKTNQEFVQIPSARLKNRIKQLCEVVGIQFIEHEESYTSKSSFLDNDFLPTFGAKPKSWKGSGKRGKKGDKIGRGQYKTAHGILINSDCNGAANIIRKVAAQLGLDLSKLVESGRAALNLPKRYSPFRSLKQAYRKRCEVVIPSSVATSA